MAADEPPYLTVGTDVSAKYKGAFCEAKIKKVSRVVKCKVTFKNNLGSFMVTDDQIKGTLRIGADIEAKHPEKNQFLEAVINKLQDYSQYTVVFDDGDETTLRRTSLCLKSGRHFAESPTLDQFPLTNPEHFGTPVIGAGKFKRKRRSTLNSSLDYESSDDDSLPRKLKAIRGKERDPDLGKVVCVDYGDRRKKDSWYPGLIVPHPANSSIKISKEEHLIRSFKDGKYYQVPKRDTREFLRENIQKIENNALKTAVEKAILYLDKEELPPHWDKALFSSLETSAEEDSHESDSDTSDDEPSEEKDRFVAQLYKFMDERGTPINKGPTVSNRDLNLYKLFKIMHKLGGYNKVTNKNKWKVVYSKMGLPQSTINGPNLIKSAYKRYLQSFEDFYRKLGCTMVNNSRSTRGRHRSDRNFMITRTRERDTASPKGRNNKDQKEKVSNEKKVEEKPRANEKKEKLEDNSKGDEKIKTPEKKKLDRLRSDNKDEKDDKKKKEEKPRLVRSQSLNKDKKETPQKEDEKKDSKPEKARTREDARKEKNESPEKKGTRSNSKIELEKKEKEEATKDKKEKLQKDKDKKDEKNVKEIKDEKPKDKKDEKSIKDRKIVKDKKVEEKVMKDKRESLPREKKDDKTLKEKRDSSKEPKEEKALKTKKDEPKNQNEEKSPGKKKLVRTVNEKKDEKLLKSKKEDKLPPESKKVSDDVDNKSSKDDKQVKNESENKKEDSVVKERPGPKLRERREDTPFSEEGEIIIEDNISDEKDNQPPDSFGKKGPFRSREDGDEPPNKGKRRSMKYDDKDEKESLINLSDSDDGSLTNDSENKDVKHAEIEIGDRVKVKYGRGRMQKVYEAKVLKIETDGLEKRYYVHYAGWNARYDDWIRKSYIVATLSSNKQKQEGSTKTTVPPTSGKRIDRGRPPGIPSNSNRKNSTSSTNSSLSSRATRSDRKNMQSSPLSSGLEPKRRRRRKSGTGVGQVETSQDSDSDVEDTTELDDDEGEDGDADAEDNISAQRESSFKEELFSDDDEKEKLEDVKRDDITELEKAICVEENTNDNKIENFNPVKKEEVIEPKLSIKSENIDLVVKIERDECMANLKIMEEKAEKKETSAQSSSEEKDTTLLSTNVDKEKTPVSDNLSVSSNTNSLDSSKKPAKEVTPAKTEPELKVVASLPFISNVTTSVSVSLPSISISPVNMKSSYVPSTPAVSENKSVLNFSGLLPEKPLEKQSVPEKPLLKDMSKIEFCSLRQIPLVKFSTRPEPEIKPLPTLFKPERFTNLYDSSGSSKPSPVTEPVKKDENLNHKETSNIFDSIVKPEETSKESKHANSNDKLVADVKQIKKSDSKNEKPVSLPVDNEFKSSEKLFKPDSSVMPAKFSTVPVDNCEKRKENFGFVSNEPKKLPEIKDNLFSLSFPHLPQKEKFTLEQPYSKLITGTPDLLRIKPKPTETVDLSKTIPGILERLKKDVVSDLKGTDSPPPPKAELNFDFLRGSQESNKSLSRSDSSNSLRICEDMSDTNDSNTDSKDLIIGEKFHPSSIPTSVLTPEVPLPLTKENNSKALETVSAPVSTDKTVPNKEEAFKQKTSVIASAPPTTSPNLLPIISEKSNDSQKEVKLVPAVKPNEGINLKCEAPVIDTVKFDNITSNLSLPTLEVKKCEEIPTVSSKETANQEQTNINVKTESKDSLFDDLLKIKSTSNNFCQNTVIKHTQIRELNTNTSSTEEEIPVLEKKENLTFNEETSSKLSDHSVPLKDVFQFEDRASSDKDSLDNVKNDSSDANVISEEKSNIDQNVHLENESMFTLLSKKDIKRKKLGKKLGKKFGSFNSFDRDDKELRNKEGKSKSKKRLRLESEDFEKGRESKSKKFKKNKNKKRFVKHDEQLGEYSKKNEFKEDDHKDSLMDKIKKKEKRKNDKKFLKSGIKSDELIDSKMELTKKKKGKKNRDKLSSDKKDFSEKKTKKKRKIHLDDNQDTDSEKESVPKLVDKKKKKDRKKFKSKDCSSSDDTGDKYYKEHSRDLPTLPSSSNALLRHESKNEDPDMSFLLCQEKVPASPDGIGNLADDTSGSSSIDGNQANAEMERLPLPSVYPCIDSIESSDIPNKHSIDTSAVLDNTPPTTPSSTESLLSSSPSHERDSFSMNYPESTQSGRDSCEGESDIFRCGANRTVLRGSEEYRAAATLAFAVCKTVAEKPKEDAASNFLKRQKSDMEEHSPSKRKKKSKRIRRISESAKSPRHKSSLSRLSKIESCCDDSSGASPATSNSPTYSNTSSLNFTRCSPHRLSCADGLSRYNFYVPLHEKDPEKRIAILQEKMNELREAYKALRAEVIAIDHKRRRARKKIREAAGAASTNPSVQAEENQNCS